MDNLIPPNQECCKNDRWFKISAIIIGTLIIVGLFGNIYLLLQKQKYPEQSKTSPTSAPAEILATPTPDPTANWKTYTNSFAKFSLKYPEDGKYAEKSYNEKEKEAVISGNFGVLTIEMAVVNYGPGWGGGCDEKDHDFITLIGQQKEVCVGETGFHELYIENPGIAQLNFRATYNLPYKTNKEIVAQILSTFKFQ